MVGGVVSVGMDQCVFVSSLLLPPLDNRKSLAVFHHGTPSVLPGPRRPPLKKNKAEIEYHRLNTRKPRSKISSFPIQIIALSCFSQQQGVSITPG